MGTISGAGPPPGECTLLHRRREARRSTCVCLRSTRLSRWTQVDGCPPQGAHAMTKARAPLDYDRYQELHRQGLSQRLIAKALGIAESTLRDNLKVMQKAQASPGEPQGDQGTPKGLRKGAIGLPQEPSHCASQGDLSIPLS